jgi:hypothetical protein
MHGLVVIEGMNLSGHPWIINEMRYQMIHYLLKFSLSKKGAMFLKVLTLLCGQEEGLGVKG